MPSDEATLTRGAVQLGEYLDRSKLTIHAFAERAGLDYAHVHRVMNGKAGDRVTVNFAKRVQDATDGEVPWTAWITDEDARDDPAAPTDSQAER